MRVHAPLLLAVGLVVAAGCSKAERGAVGTGPKTYRLDPSATLRRIELLSPGMPPTKGLYEVSGDTLRLCLNTDQRAPAEYPAGFVSRASPTTDLLTLKRGKP